jgi:hypothetical protein
MIENTVTGEIFQTAVLPLAAKEAAALKKKDWVFDWAKEAAAKDRQTYKLTTVENPKVIHGLISLSDKKDHVFANLVENAAFNKGRAKLYRHVLTNLMAFACMEAFLKKYDGVVLFVSKTALVEHYRLTLGATIFVGNKIHRHPGGGGAGEHTFQRFQISMTMNLKRVDDVDAVFMDEPLTPEESRRFSELLKKNKEKRRRAFAKAVAARKGK